MLDITLLSFIFHEYGHVYNGHLDYLVSVKASKKPSASFISLNADREQPIITFPIRHQALEWNADDFLLQELLKQFSVIIIGDFLIETINYLFRNYFGW